MERPQRPNLVDIINDHGRRLRTIERHGHPLQTTLEVLDEGTSLGLIESMNFEGLNVQVIPDRDGHVRVIMAGTAATFDAIVDSTLINSDPHNRLFKGIGEALTYLFSTVGLTNRALVLVRPGTYTETSNWTNADMVYLFGLNKQPYQLASQTSSVIWDHANFSGNSASWVLENLEVRPGNSKLSGFSGQLSARHCIINSSGAASGLIWCNDLATYLDCGFQAMRRLATNRAFLDDCDVQPENNSPPSITLAGTLLYARGFTFAAAGGFGAGQTWAVPSTTIFECNEGINRMNQSSSGSEVTITASSPAILSITNKGGEALKVTVTGTPKKVFLEGTFGDVVVPSPDTRANGGKSHRLDITCDELTVGGPASLDVRATNEIHLSGNSITGVINLYGTIGSGDVFLDFVNADYCTLLASAPGSLGAGTAKPYAFDAASGSNILTFAGAAGFPAAGTDAGVGNLITVT